MTAAAYVRLHWVVMVVVDYVARVAGGGCGFIFSCQTKSLHDSEVPKANHAQMSQGSHSMDETHLSGSTIEVEVL